MAVTKRTFRVVAGTAALVLAGGAAVNGGHTSTFRFVDGTALLPVLGFEAFTPPVLSPNGSLLVIAEENASGSSARLSILELDAEHGEPIRQSWVRTVPGFQEGVPPFFLGQAGFIVAPCQEEDGSEAQVRMLRLDAGPDNPTEEVISLGDLGFRRRGRSDELEQAGIIVLENRERSARGILRILGFDSTVLVSTDGRSVADINHAAPWLPPLAEGLVPVLFPAADGTFRLAWPAATASGADIVLITMPDDGRSFPQEETLAGLNGRGFAPLGTKGFAKDVDLVVTERGLLAPMQGAGGAADLALFDAAGWLVWRLSEQAERQGLTPGRFAEGVGITVLTGDRIAVPLEYDNGETADLWIVDLESGVIVARARDENNDLSFPGLVTGVRPQNLLVPVEDARGAGLLLFRRDATLEGSLYGDPLVGFKPWIHPVGDYVPTVNGDGSFADIVFFRGPHLQTPYSLSEVIPDLRLHDFERGVGPLIVNGGGYLYVPEQDPVTGEARLRIEQIPGEDHVLVIADQGHVRRRAGLYFVDVGTNHLLLGFDDLLGFVTGVSMIGTGHRH